MKILVIFYCLVSISKSTLQLEEHEQNFVNTQKQILIENVGQHCNGQKESQVKFGDKEFNIQEELIGGDKFEMVRYHVFFGNQEDLQKDFEGVLELEYIEFQQPINDVIDQFAREFCFQMKQINFDLKEIKILLESAFEYALQDHEEYEEGVVHNYTPKQFRLIDLSKDQNTSAYQKREEITFQLGDIILEEDDMLIYGINISDVKFDSMRLKIEKQMQDNKPTIKFEILSSFYKINHELDYMSKAYLIEKIIQSFQVIKTAIFENLEMINLTYTNHRVDYIPESQNDPDKKKIIPIAYSIVKDILFFVISHDDLFDTNFKMVSPNHVIVNQSEHIQDQCKFSIEIGARIDETTNQPFSGFVKLYYTPRHRIDKSEGNYEYSFQQGFALDSQFNNFGTSIIIIRNFIRQIATTVYQLNESKSQKYYAENVINPYVNQILIGDTPVELVQAEMNQRLEPDITRIYTNPIHMNVDIPYNYGLKSVKVVYRQVPELLKKIRKKRDLI